MRIDEDKKVKVKSVRAGNYMQITVFRDPHLVEGPPPFRKKNRKKKVKPKRDAKYEEYLAEQILKRSLGQTRTRLRLLIYANLTAWTEFSGKRGMPVFLTLTYKENQTSLKDAKKDFLLFIKKLNYSITGSKKGFLKYVAVPEFQKRGAVHYHIIFFNLSYIKKNELKKIWGHGIVDIKKVEGEKNMINYLLKYMTKDFMEQMKEIGNRYLPSRGLVRPTVNRDTEFLLEFIKHYSHQLDNAQIDTFSYLSPYAGDIDQFIYWLGDAPVLRHNVLASEQYLPVHSKVKEILCDTSSTSENLPIVRIDKSSPSQTKLPILSD